MLFYSSYVNFLTNSQRVGQYVYKDLILKFYACGYTQVVGMSLTLYLGI